MRKLLFTGFLFPFFLGVQAQSINPSVVSSSGGHFVNASHQLSFTLGEPVIATYSNTSNSLTQGFHQTKLSVISIGEILMETGIKVYPNPVVEYINVETTNLGNDVWLNLYATDGKLLLHKKMLSPTEKINMESFAEGTYLLTLESANNTLQTVTIIKAK